MSTYDDYRTIDVTIDGANDYPAQIIVSTGDTDGRRIRAKFMVDGTPVMDATGAAIYYGNDNVPADSVPMTEESDGVYTGVIPTAAYAGKACATVTVGLKKGESIVMSRSIRLIIDHAFGDDAPDNIDAGQLEDAINRAETAADNAESSAAAAGTSATAAKASETNAASSASAAKVSETNAAASATAAQQAVNGFGLEVGTTTTGEPGSDATVEIQKQGTKYTANFTIPRGDVGPAGVNENVPLGAASGVVAQATDAYPALPRKVQVRGRTVENLWPAINNPQYNDWTCATDKTGLMHVATITTTTTTAYFIDPIGLVPGKTYTGRVSTNPPAGVKVRVQGTSGGSVFAFADFDADGTVFTIPGDATDINYCVACEPAESTSVDYKTRVMLVEGDTVPDVFVPSGVNTVEPEKLVAAGKNIYDESYANLNESWGRGEFDENGDLLIYSNSDTINKYENFLIVKEDYQFPEGEYVVSARLPNIPNSRLKVYNETDKSSALLVNNKYPSVTSGNVTINPEKKYTVSVEFVAGIGTTEAVKVSDIQIERGTVQTSYSKPETTFTNLPSDISLADGDTLTIDRDGTTQILHADGEPTVLENVTENVTLPELPAPTFNVYTIGGNIQPTVYVDYEQDVNLVLQALEAKIASLEVTQTIMKGA